MSVEFVQEGRAIDYTPAADVASGDVVVQGDLVGVAKKDIKANELGALATEGVFDFPKDGATAIAAGVDVYWDAAAKQATEDPAGGANKHVGKTVAAAAATDTTVRVKLAGAGGTTGEVGVETVQQTVALSDFTDDGAASGHVDLTEQVPAGALVLGVELDVTTAFAGGTSPTAQVGDTTNTDRFTANGALAVDAVAQVGSEAPDTAGNAYVGSATTVRVTVTDGGASPDFTGLTAGQVTATVAYLKL